MLDPGSLLPMIRSEIAIFDLTDQFYSMKNDTYVSWNRLWQFDGFRLGHFRIAFAQIVYITYHGNLFHQRY